MGTASDRATRTARRRLEPRSRSLAVAMLALASMAAGCEYFGKGKAAEAPPAPAPPVVQVIEAKPQAVKIYSEWVAQTYSQEAVDVRARVNGYIEERRFNPGDLVKQGDILYKLDDRPYKAQVDRAKGISPSGRPTSSSPRSRCRCSRRKPSSSKRGPTC